MARLLFFGVRGSYPTPSAENLIFGGNTSCVVIYSDADRHGDFPLIFDLGTGLGVFSKLVPPVTPFNGTAFLSHFHFDHIQGLPFFSPVDREGAKLKIYAPSENGVSPKESLDRLITSPYFPVTLGDLRGVISVETISSTVLEIDQPGAPRIMVREVEHTNSTLGFRIDLDGKSIAYIPDHQAPREGARVEESVIELASGVDLLIHDAQYSFEEFSDKSHWGHSTYEYAIEVARATRVKALAFFHHDPAHNDVQLAKVERLYQSTTAGSGIDIFLAREGSEVSL